MLRRHSPRFFPVSIPAETWKRDSLSCWSTCLASSAMRVS